MNNTEGKFKLSHCQTPKIQTNSHSKEILAEFHEKALAKKRTKFVCTAFNSRQKPTWAELSMIYAHYYYTLIIWDRKRRQLSLHSFLPRAHSCMMITLFCPQMAFLGVSQPAVCFWSHSAPFWSLFIHRVSIFNLRFWKFYKFPK